MEIKKLNLTFLALLIVIITFNFNLYSENTQENNQRYKNFSLFDLTFGCATDKLLESLKKLNPNFALPEQERDTEAEQGILSRFDRNTLPSQDIFDVDFKYSNQGYEKSLILEKIFIYRITEDRTLLEKMAIWDDKHINILGISFHFFKEELCKVKYSLFTDRLSSCTDFIKEISKILGETSGKIHSSKYINITNVYIWGDDKLEVTVSFEKKLTGKNKGYYISMSFTDKKLKENVNEYLNGVKKKIEKLIIK